VNYLPRIKIFQPLRIPRRGVETSYKFEFVDEYATFVLEEVIKDVSEEDKQKVKERLRALGYLD